MEPHSRTYIPKNQLYYFIQKYFEGLITRLVQHVLDSSLNNGIQRHYVKN